MPVPCMQSGGPETDKTNGNSHSPGLVNAYTPAPGVLRGVQYARYDRD